MSTAPPSTAIAASWFDGLSTRARPASVQLIASAGGPRLQLRALDKDQTLELAHHQVGWPERWSAGRAPPRVVVDLGEHGSLQIDDPLQWQDMLMASGRRPPLAERMQTQLRVLLGVLLVASVGIWAFYRWGTPWAATQIARHVPLAWELALTERAMKEIDETYVKPTKLAPERQAEIREGFGRLTALIGPDLQRYPGYAPPLKLEFRSGMPANAFALPGGTIVMTDAMVEKARSSGAGDTALLGVLAHEIGHVDHRHTTRMVVEQGVLNAGLGLALGDVSSIVSFSSSLLTGLAYRRSHETEADCYAVAMMGKAGLPTKPMTDLLLSIENDAQEKQAGNKAAASAPPPNQGPRESGAFDWFSTHPDTAGRAKNLCPQRR
ncbi:M48 family metallopeptidase [Ottowia thiooxydans]|uniref:Zn-dependent protease with chaperone function n=1 Tax=Ottowia thiooxydans TaxID=219182 RepID=A0ABV2QFU5_9BURK